MGSMFYASPMLNFCKILTAFSRQSTSISRTVTRANDPILAKKRGGFRSLNPAFERLPASVYHRRQAGNPEERDRLTLPWRGRGEC